MYWLRLLWAVVRGIAWGVSDAKWDEFVAERTGRKQGQAPQSDAPPPGSSTGTAAPSEPAAGVQVDTDRKEGEFTGGLPYMGGSSDPRVRPSHAAAAQRDGESRRKRRTRQADPSPAEQVCARCKMAMQHDLTAQRTEDLAIAQEVALDEATSANNVHLAGGEAPAAGDGESEGDAEGNEGTIGTDGESESSESPAESDVSRPALAKRLVTRLGTRASLTRLSEARASLTNQATGG